MTTRMLKGSRNHRRNSIQIKEGRKRETGNKEQMGQRTNSKMTHLQ